MKWIAARLAGAVLLLAGSSFLTFVLLDLAPGDFLSDVRMDSRISVETLSTLEERYGLDRPLPVRYAAWLAGVVQGDWGRSFASDLPVLPVLRERAMRTLALAAGAQTLAWILALGIAAFTALRPTGWLRRVCEPLANVLLSIPEIVVSLLALLPFIRLGVDAPAWLPAALALVAGAFPFLWKQADRGLRETSALPFVEAAHDRGLPPGLILRRYMLPAAAAPLISIAGVSIGGLLSASLMAECVTGYPGLGPLLLDAVFARDPFVVAGAILVSTLIWMAGSLAADFAQIAVDPRARARA